MKITKAPITQQEVAELLQKGSRFIAPLWSLENFVAVNAYMGMADWSFEKAMDFLNKTANTDGTLPTSFYIEALEKSRLTEADIAQALEGNTFGLTTDAQEFIAKYFEAQDDVPDFKIQTLVDVASEMQGKRWNRFMIDSPFSTL